MKYRSIINKYVVFMGCVSILTLSPVAVAHDSGPTSDNPLPLSEVLDEIDRDGPFLWKNLGPVYFEDDELSAQSASAVMRWLEAFDRSHLQHPDGLPVSFEETTRLSQDGELWVIVDVDWPAYDAKVHDYNISANEPGPVFDLMSDGWVEDQEDEVIPLSWTGGTCASGEIDWALWSGESRIQITPPSLTLRQQTSVYITSGVNNKPCSGVLLHNRWVLTAAHCVTGPNGYRLDPKKTVVRLGNNLYSPSGTRNAKQIYLDGEPWNGNTRRDYALVELDRSLGSEHMWLSQVNNATIAAHDVLTLGYPVRVNGASCTSTGGRMYRETAAVTGVTTHTSGRGIVKTRLDATSRQSGSPMYYCPHGADSNICGTGQAGYVVGVLATIHLTNGSVTDTRGPKVPGTLRNWAVPFLPNH